MSESDGSLPLSLEATEAELAWRALQFVEQQSGLPQNRTAWDPAAIGSVKTQLQGVQGASSISSPLAQFQRELQKMEEEARTAAVTRLVRALGEIVESSHATSGWVFLLRETLVSGDFDGSRSSDGRGDGDKKDSTEMRVLPVAAYNAPEVHIDRVAAESKNGIVGCVAKTGVRQLLGDVRKNPLYISDVPSTRSELTVPIKDWTGSVIGVLNLEANYLNAFCEPQGVMVEAKARDLVMDLLVLSQCYSNLRRVATHPARHGWCVTPLVNRLCESIALSLPTQFGNPAIGCTVWLLDNVKQRVHAIGATRFDFEYLADKSLPAAESHIGKAILEYQGHPDHHGDADPHKNVADLSGFARGMKARRMELRTVAVFPFSVPLVEFTEPESSEQVAGALVIFGFDHEWGIRGVSISSLFNRHVGRVLANLVSTSLHELWSLRANVARAYLHGSLANDVTAARNPLETVKRVFLDVFTSQGCSVFVKTASNQLEVAATTGLLSSDRGETSLAGSYELKSLEGEETQTSLRFLPMSTANKTVVQIGLTNFLAQKPQAVIRKNDVVNLEEPVCFTYVRDELHKGYFAPRNSLVEAFAPGIGEYMRFLGVAVTSKANEVEGVIRLTRSGTELPYMRIDEVLAQTLAGDCCSVFAVSKEEIRNSDSYEYVSAVLSRVDAEYRNNPRDISTPIISEYGVRYLANLGRAVSALDKFLQKKGDPIGVAPTLNQYWQNSQSEIDRIVERGRYWNRQLRVDSVLHLTGALLSRPALRTDTGVSSRALLESVLEDLNLLSHAMVADSTGRDSPSIIGKNPTVLSDLRIVTAWGAESEPSLRLMLLKPAWKTDRSDDFERGRPWSLSKPCCGTRALERRMPVSVLLDAIPGAEFFHSVHPLSDWVRQGICYPIFCNDKLKGVVSVDFATVFAPPIVSDRLLPALVLAARKIEWILGSTSSEVSMRSSLHEFVQTKWSAEGTEVQSGATFTNWRKEREGES